jgi:spore maturation protein CgeB
MIIMARGDVATISWTTDDSWKYREVSRFIGKAYHAMTTTYEDAVPKYHRDGIPNILLTQWAANVVSLLEPQPAQNCHYPVSFVGQAHGDRLKRIEHLRSLGLEVSCFGHGWPSGSVKAEDIPKIYRDSVISLNFANSKGVNQIKARTFEVPGAGGFLLTEGAPGLDKYYTPDKEVAVFDGLKDLVEKAKYYLSHPEERDAIAKSGFDRTKREHTYDLRMKEVIDFALKAKEEWVKMGPHPPPPSFEETCLRHRLTLILRLLRFILTTGAAVVWGPVRGQRAARRLVFELSWRLAGERTFSAVGWPGRMFPNV